MYTKDLSIRLFGVMLFLVPFLTLFPSSSNAGDPGQSLANPFALTLDISQGSSLQQTPIVPFLFSTELGAELPLGDFGVGPLTSVRFSNPGWNAGLGLRADYLFCKFGPSTGFRLAADVIPWFDQDNITLKGGLLGDFSGLARIGLWYGHDTGNGSSSLMASVGVDFISIGKLLESGPPEPDFTGSQAWPGSPQALKHGARNKGRGLRTALVLSGGGCTGAYEVGAILYMMERKMNFDMVCGTSTGALIAPLLVTGEVPELKRLFTNVTTPDIYLAFSPADMISKGSAFSTAPLQKLIGEIITDDRWKAIQASPMQMILCTADMRTAQPDYFFTGPSNVRALPQAGTNRIQDRDTLMRALLASSSEPILCPSVHVPASNPDPHVDGGVLDFAPITMALLNGADVVYAVVLSPEDQGPGPVKMSGLAETLEQTIRILVNRVAMDDLIQARYLADKLGKKLVVIQPDKPLTDKPEEFDPAQMTKMVTAGYDQAKKVILHDGPPIMYPAGHGEMMSEKPGPATVDAWKAF